MIGLLLLCAFTPSEALRDAIARHESVPVDDVEIGDFGALAGAPDDAIWGVQLPEATGLCGGVAVVFTTEGHRYAVRAPVTVWRAVPVSETAVRPGDRIQLSTARIACSRLGGELPVDPAGTWRAGVSIAAGAPVTVARVREWPDAQKGAAVRIEAAAGSLSVAAPGQLLQDGFEGRKVAVLNLATHAVLIGTYAGENVVTLEAP